MSYISRLIAVKFGGLSSKTLSLKNGLNIIYGPNEAGKSTWAALIKMMFYGWGSKKDEKLDYEKYCKDSNFLIKTFIQDYDSQELLLERAKKDACKAIFTQSNQDCPDLTGGMPGEILFGVDRATFEKTSFVGQLQMEAGKTEGIEKKLATILKTGDAGALVSYEVARQELEEICKEISGTRGTGRIKNLSIEIDALNQMLEANRKLLVELNEEKIKLSEYESDFDEAQKLSLANEAFLAKETLGKIIQLKLVVKEKQDKFKVMNELITRDGIVPNQAFVKEGEGYLRNCENLFSSLENLKMDVKAMQQEEVSLKDKSSNYTKKLSNMQFSMLALIGIMSIILVFFSIFSKNQIIFFIFCILGLMVFGTVFFVSTFKKLSKRKMDSEIEKQIVQIKKETTLKAQNRLEVKSKEFEKSVDNLKRNTKHYFENYEDLTAVKGALNSLKNQLSDVNSLENEVNNALSRIESFLINNTEAKLIELSKNMVEDFDVGEALQAEEKSRIVDVRIREIRELIASKTAVLKTNGKNLDDIEVELSYKNELLEEFEIKDAAAKLALKVMGEAYQDFSNRYAPELAKRTEAIFSYITDLKYDVANMNSDFDIVVTNSKTMKRLGEGKMSAGTLEQLWLSLRLALVELIFEKSKMTPPLVLDDAFVNFDESRCFRGLDYLLEIAKKKQVILFTCHKREWEYFGNNSDVNLINAIGIWAI